MVTSGRTWRLRAEAEAELAAWTAVFAAAATAGDAAGDADSSWAAAGPAAGAGFEKPDGSPFLRLELAKLGPSMDAGARASFRRIELALHGRLAADLTDMQLLRLLALKLALKPPNDPPPAASIVALAGPLHRRLGRGAGAAGALALYVKRLGIAELEVLLGFVRETALVPGLLKLSKGTRVDGLEVRGPGRISIAPINFATIFTGITCTVCQQGR